jgi:hypothetical protein
VRSPWPCTAGKLVDNPTQRARREPERPLESAQPRGGGYPRKAMTSRDEDVGHSGLVIRTTKVFDPARGFAPLTNVVELTDATLARRDGRWWMYLAGEALGHEGIRLFSASLPANAPLAAAGWELTPEPQDSNRIALLAPSDRSASWDLRGGRHCPAYVRGFDAGHGEWVDRIYYAGAAETPWGPYSIGYLEWDGTAWREQSEPVFVAVEDWEHGSVYEPNLVYADGLWRMWYVAGSNQDDYLVQGLAESADGRTGWTRKQFASPEDKVFDFCVQPVDGGYEAVFSRVWVAPSAPPTTTGLWWCRADRPSSNRADWSEPIQIMNVAHSPWQVGPWKPTWHCAEGEPRRLLIFFDGIVRKDEPGGFPFAFALGCLEVERPG